MKIFKKEINLKKQKYQINSCFTPRFSAFLPKIRVFFPRKRLHRAYFQCFNHFYEIMLNLKLSKDDKIEKLSGGSLALADARCQSRSVE